MPETAVDELRQRGVEGVTHRRRALGDGPCRSANTITHALGRYSTSRATVVDALGGLSPSNRR